MYLAQELSDINPEYLRLHGEITETDVKRVNQFLRQLEEVADAPLPGDVVCVTEQSFNGETIYADARIQRIRDGKAHICLNVLHSPHVKVNEGTLSISGGRWVSIPTKDLQFKKRQSAMFWLWGDRGNWSSGGSLNFGARVRQFSGFVDARPKANVF